MWQTVTLCLVKALTCPVFTGAPSILSTSSEWLALSAVCPQVNICIWLDLGCGVEFPAAGVGMREVPVGSLLWGVKKQSLEGDGRGR